MTKVTIYGEVPDKKELKKIEFIKCLDFNEIADAETEPSEWENIELICRKYTSFDLMFAYDGGKRSDGCLYLGHFNDGIV